MPRSKSRRSRATGRTRRAGRTSPRARRLPLTHSLTHSAPAVCSWSLQPISPEDLLEKLKETGIKQIQLALDPLREAPENWFETGAFLDQNGVQLVSGMFGCAGEDYSTLDSIRATGGIAPDATWLQNLANFRRTVALAERLGLDLVTFHAGFMPHDQNDPAYLKMLDRLGHVADLFAVSGIDIGLETGQETAALLREMLERLARPNLGVNFDPANMILYDKGDPIEAVRTLGPWLRQVHIKDARRTKLPGTWGEEVAVGDGEVNWPHFLSALKKLQFKGSLVIEREAGNQRVEDIRRARELIDKLWRK